MDKKFKTIKRLSIAGLFTVTLFASCVSDPNSPGVEYMPDMYRSPSIEAYVDYGEVMGKHVDSLVKENPALYPPMGTVPFSKSAINDMPYPFGAPLNSDITHGLFGFRMDSLGKVNASSYKNPIAYSPEIEKEGKRLYGNYCMHCHGEKGDGQGPVITKGQFPQPGAYNGPLKELTEGDIFYAITYGKGAMGAHGSIISKEDRWKIVHYVEKLQGKTKGDAPESTEEGEESTEENNDEVTDDAASE